MPPKTRTAHMLTRPQRRSNRSTWYGPAARRWRFSRVADRSTERRHADRSHRSRYASTARPHVFSRHVRTDSQTAQEAMEKYTIEKASLEKTPCLFGPCLTIPQEIAHHIKRTVRVPLTPPLARMAADAFQFDERKGATWHCIVGRNFGSFVTHGTCPPLALCSRAQVPANLRQQRQSTSSTSTWATAPSCSSRRSRRRTCEIPWEFWSRPDVEAFLLQRSGL